MEYYTPVHFVDEPETGCVSPPIVFEESSPTFEDCVKNVIKLMNESLQKYSITLNVVSHLASIIFQSFFNFNFCVLIYLCHSCIQSWHLSKEVRCCWTNFHPSLCCKLSAGWNTNEKSGIVLVLLDNSLFPANQCQTQPPLEVLICFIWQAEISSTFPIDDHNEMRKWKSNRLSNDASRGLSVSLYSTTLSFVIAS